MAKASTKPVVLSLHAFIEPKGESLITNVWKQAAKAKLDVGHDPKGIRPHMTLGSWVVDAMPDELPEQLEETLRVVPATPLMLTMRLMPRERAYFTLVPFIHRKLLDWHEEIHDTLGEIGRPHRVADQPGTWNAHISLMNCDEKDVAAAYQLAKTLPVPLKTGIVSMGLIAYGSNTPVETVVAFDIDQ